jgi:glutathione-regulated potassium-efflux system ancillary protein KefC
MDTDGFLQQALIYLGAGVIAVPIFTRLGAGAVLGYLVAGIVIGPWGLRLITEAQTVLHFAELGIVLLLFLVGLELNVNRVWSLRRAIFGLGGTQVALTTAAVAAIALALGQSLTVGLVAGMGFAMSSTAIGLAMLSEKNLLPTPGGQASFAVLLFQDLAVIPLLLVLAFLGGEAETFKWSDAAIAVVFVAALMQAVGLSMALGAFLAGVLLAESEYRRELETDIEPFKGLLLGLFFIAVGMSIDFAVVIAQPLLIAGVVLGFLLLKAFVLWGMGRLMPLPRPERPVFIILLAQGGEFGFVVFQTAAAAGVIDAQASSLLVAAVAISMLVTPLLLVAADKWLIPLLAGQAKKKTALQELQDPQNQAVIIAGFGRYGQIVGRMLYANGIKPTVLDVDAEQIEAMRRFGWPVFYGDATRLDLMRTAGAATARVLVLAIDDVDQSVEVAKMVRENFPDLTIVARARNVTHYFELHDLGVTMIERETLDSALMSARSVLEQLGWERHQARTLALRFRRHNVDQLVQMGPHRKDEAKLIAVAKQGRQQLEELFAQERDEAAKRQARVGWNDEADTQGTPPS